MNDQKMTPLMKQYWDVKEKHPDKLILFRMGDFYETFYEDAKVSSKVLGITLTTRNKSSEDAPPLAGFPYHALDNYMDKLVQAGLKIVIVEQVEDPKLAKGLVKREIVEIITPGAILDEKLISKKDHVFLASIFWDLKHTKTGLSFIDISTGDFKYTEIHLNQLKDELLRHEPREILVQTEEHKKVIEDLRLERTPAFTIYDTYYYDLPEAKKFVKDHFKVLSLEGLGLQNKSVGIVSSAVALHYLKSLRSEDLSYINHLEFYSPDDFMMVDEVSRRNLELFRSLRYGDREGTLISVLDETKTPMGARELVNILQYPLMNEIEINKRLDAVQIFKENIAFTRDLREILYEIGDLSRIISRLATLKVNARDLLALASYLETSPRIYQVLDRFDSELINDLKLQINDFSPIIDDIHRHIMDNPPLTITEGNIIQDGIHTELDELRVISRDGKGWIARLEESEKQKTGISTLKVGFNKVFGYYIEVTRLQKDKVPDYYIAKQTLVNAERYISPQLKEHESRVLGAEERIKNIEYEIFHDLRKRLSEAVPLLQNYVEIIAKLDVLANFGFIAHKNNYVRPRFNLDGEFVMQGVRHPVIERLLINDPFIPNDVYLNDQDHKIALITGPNMAGKSTYLRQIGLLTIMAQSGCFVSADQCNISIVDKVFTRVGASDNLAQGQSTFLVEMIETANILHSATPQSLILLDEIGRGTSTFDGLSLAWSIVEFIHDNPKIQSKTLFATHYHELTELENLLSGVKNYNVAVKEWNDQIIFLRKIERGGADQSYGIHVARLAGIPQKVISRAKQILKNLEAIEISPQGLTARIKKQLSKTQQINIFDLIVEEHEEKDKTLTQIRDILTEIEIDSLTPLQALQKLNELKTLLKEN